MDVELVSKRAIVTGGSRGIGRAVADQLAAEGVDLVLVARGEDELRSAAAEIADRYGRRVVPVPADTADTGSVAAMVAQAREELGGVDILVNAAARSAGGGGGPVSAAPDALLREFDIKTLGYLRCAQAVAPLMVEQGWGRIVNVGGLAARETGAVSASMRNAAVAALTKNLADELGPHGVNVTAVHPGTTRTERIAGRGNVAEAGARYALGRIVEPAEVAWVVVFLASPRGVAINGDVVACGGGRLGAIHY